MENVQLIISVIGVTVSVFFILQSISMYFFNGEIFFLLPSKERLQQNLGYIFIVVIYLGAIIVLQVYLPKSVVQICILMAVLSLFLGAIPMFLKARQRAVIEIGKEICQVDYIGDTFIIVHYFKDKEKIILRENIDVLNKQQNIFSMSEKTFAKKYKGSL